MNFNSPSYTVILHRARIKAGLTCNEYVIASTVFHLQNNEMTPGWCYASKEWFAELLGLSKRSIITLIAKLESMGFLQKSDGGKLLKATQKWRDEIENFSDGEESSPMKKTVKKVHRNGEESSPKSGEESSPYNNSNIVIDNNRENGLFSDLPLKSKKTKTPPFPPLDFAGFDNQEQAGLIWEDWIDYKREQKRFKYKNTKYEQIALNDLCQKSQGKAEYARLIVEASIANGYSGLFELRESDIRKNQSLGKMGPVYDVELNGQTEAYQTWWKTLETKFPNVKAEVRFFSASEFLAYQHCDWFPTFRESVSKGLIEKRTNQCLTELESDAEKRRRVKSLYTALTKYHLEQCGIYEHD